MISVKVCWQQTGKAAENRKVALGFDGFFGGVSSTEYTNSSGEAHFDNDPGSGKVYVDGSTVFSGRLEGRVVVYVS